MNANARPAPPKPDLLRRLAGWVLVTQLAGCVTVGPDFVAPAAPEGAGYTDRPLAHQTQGSTDRLGAAQTFEAGDEATGTWWTRFGSDKLNRVVALGLEHNHSVAAASAALVQAREYAQAVQDTLTVPSLDASLAQTRERFSTAAFGQPGGAYTFSLTNASVNVAYPLDLFGGNRRRIEALDAQQVVQAALWQAARETLAANIVTTAIREATLRAQYQAVQSVVHNQIDNLTILQAREPLGGVSANDLVAPRTDLASSRTTLAGLAQQIDLTRHQLASYLGDLPAQEGSLPTFTLADFTLPNPLPVSLPSSLVHRRPDIRASEAQLHAATAQLGVTISGAYPSLDLTGSLGAMALTPGQIFNASSAVWSLGAGITQPLFHGGALEAEERSSKAALEAAVEQYRETVVQAFRNVADVLRALDHDAETLVAQTEASSASQSGLSLTEGQYQTGAIAYPVLLGARNRALQSDIDRAQAEGLRLADTAALFLALGGGDGTLKTPASAPHDDGR